MRDDMVFLMTLGSFCIGVAMATLVATGAAQLVAVPIWWLVTGAVMVTGALVFHNTRNGK